MKNQKIIFVCGPDMCGKTQIAKEFSRRTGIPYFKASSEHASFLKGPDRFINQLKYADPRVLDLLKQTGHSVVFDRGFPCELVYATALGRDSDMPTLTELDEGYAELGAHIIVCFRSSYKGIVDDLDPRIDETRLSELSALYMKFSRWSKCNVHLLNVDDEDLNREVNEVMSACGVKEVSQ